MRILITSGGTKVPIDPVRNITNSSSGRFGTALAKAALVANMEVIYLAATDALSPFCESFDYYTDNNWEKNLTKLKALHAFSEQYSKQYREYRYDNFDDYNLLVKSLVVNENPDITLLAAAVSDYLVSNYADSKIRSNNELSIQLQSAPKVIHAIKTWNRDTFLVGFKLLVNATDEELITAGQKSLAQHQSDLVIANDLSTIKNGKHEIIMIEKDGSFQKYTDKLATTIISRCLKR